MKRSFAPVALAFGLLGTLHAEESVASGLQLVSLEGNELRVTDLESGAVKTLATEVGYYRFDPVKRRVLFSDLENLYLSDLAGEKKTLLHLEKIVHPGCGHIESAIHDAVLCDGGVTVLVRVREVPAGVDPHEHADSQYKVLAVATDGTAKAAVDTPPMLLSDGSNSSLGDISPDGTRSIISRSKPAEDDALEVELREHDGRGGGDGKEIARFTLPSLTYVQGSWSPDGKLYAFMIASITYRKHEIRAWDGKECRTIASGACGLGLGGTGSMVLEWAADSRRLVILPNDRAKGPSVQVLDAVAGNATATLPIGSNPGLPVFIPGSKSLAVLDYAACPLKGSHQHRFAACRPSLHLLDPDAAKARDLAAGEHLADAPPLATPDGKHLLVFTVASEKAPAAEWDEPVARVYALKPVNLETGKAGEALKGVEFKSLPRLVRVEKK